MGFWFKKFGGFNSHWSDGWASKGWGFKSGFKKKSWCDDRDDSDRDDAPLSFSWKQKSCEKNDFKFDFGKCKPVKWGCRDDDDGDHHGGHGHHHSHGRGHWDHKGFGWGHKKHGCHRDDDAPEEPPVEEAVNTAPEITAPGDTNITVNGFRAGTFAADVDAIDADGDTLIFSIVDTPGKDDGDLFEIDAATGVITVAPQGINRASEDGDTTFTVDVEVTDGEATDTIQLDLTIDFLAA
jgi:hypothetical protein